MLKCHFKTKRFRIFTNGNFVFVRCIPSKWRAISAVAVAILSRSLTRSTSGKIFSLAQYLMKPRKDKKLANKVEHFA